MRIIMMTNMMYKHDEIAVKEKVTNQYHENHSANQIQSQSPSFDLRRRKSSAFSWAFIFVRTFNPDVPYSCLVLENKVMFHPRAIQGAWIHPAGGAKSSGSLQRRSSGRGRVGVLGIEISPTKVRYSRIAYAREMMMIFIFKQKILCNYIHICVE